MTARYLLCPGHVRSRVDRDVHFVGARELAMLYGVRMSDCVVLPNPGREAFPCERLRLLERCEDDGDLIALTPRRDGYYRIPAPAVSGENLPGPARSPVMPEIIKPTVGRKVWYRHCLNDMRGPMPMSVAGPIDDPSKAQPLDATIIAVWGDRMVNVLVTDFMGKQFPVLSVTLLQPGDEPQRDADGKVVGRYVEWMPYQQAQAAKESAPDNAVGGTA